MDYRRFIASSHVDFKVNDHLVECGSTTWQIRNIAATSISKKVIPFNEPEPRFETAEPKLELNFSAMAIAAAIAWGIVRFFLSSPNFAIVVALGVAGAMIYFAVDSLNTKKSEWLSAKGRIESHWKVWDEMRRNPPVLFSLMLETNAGSKPLFYSFDEPQIAKANNTIKRSMEKKETGDVKFEIETVNMGGEESINNFGSSIYNQSIQGGNEMTSGFYNHNSKIVNQVIGTLNIGSKSQSEMAFIKQQLDTILERLKTDANGSDAGVTNALSAAEDIRRELASNSPKADVLDRSLRAIDGISSVASLAAQIRALLSGLF